MEPYFVTPIPADLAPISGNGKRKKKSTLEKVENLLDPIKFRYRDEKVVEDQPQAEPAEEPAQEPSRSRRRRNRHNKADVILQEAAVEAPKAETQEAVPAQEEEKGKNHHHRNYHHRRHRHHKGVGKAAE